MGKINKEVLKGSTETLILKVLQREPLYGYQIAKSLKKLSTEIFNLGEGTLYPLLHKLEKQKLLDSYWQEVGGRKRKYYSLTKKGRKVLQEKTAEWQTFSQAVNHVIKS